MLKGHSTTKTKQKVQHNNLSVYLGQRTFNGSIILNNYCHHPILVPINYTDFLSICTDASIEAWAGVIQLTTADGVLLI